MRRAIGARFATALCAVGLVVTALAGTTLAPPAGATTAHRYPARLLVYAQEWSLTPSRATLPAGRVVVELWNRGMDPHDLRARRISPSGRMWGRTWAVPITLPSHIHTATWTLPAGHYQLYCSLPGHMKAGMHVRITVRRD